MDLMPPNYNRKDLRKRFRTPRVVKFWRNPLQVIIIGVSLVSFATFNVVDHIKLRRNYEEQFVRAEKLRKEVDDLNVQAMLTYTNLQALLEGEVLKESDKELSLEHKLKELTSEIDSRFNQMNDCYAAIPFRYQSKFEVQHWFVDFTRQCLQSALARKDYEQARLWFNTSHVNVLMKDIRSRVKGDGSLEIMAGSDVYEVVVWPLKSDGPRLVPADAVGRSTDFPYTIPEIEKGSYLILVTRGDGGFAPYPVFIEHGQAKRVELEIAARVPKGMNFVPGGEFYCGGTNSSLYRLHKNELPSFFIKQKEVAVREYLEFWTGLDEPAMKEAFMSRVRYDESEVEPTNAWDSEGKLLDERLSLDYPVVGITPAAAKAYCEWLSGQVGRTVRLPTSDEWEKAARGVDGRTYPWGYDYDPSANLALTQDNAKGKGKYPLMAPPGSFMRDVSVYNAYDMAGNVREMTSSTFPDDETGAVQVKGGSASTPSSFLPCSHVSKAGTVAPSDVGFRYIMEISRKDQ